MAEPEGSQHQHETKNGRLALVMCGSRVDGRLVARYRTLHGRIEQEGDVGIKGHAFRILAYCIGVVVGSEN